MSQDALAVAAGVTERTVQRIERGENISLQSKRSLARALGYDDPKIFEDPNFIATVMGLVESMRVDAIKAEEELHPDHVKIEATATVCGADLARLIDEADATVFHCDDSAGEEARSEAAAFFDNLRDWGDLWSGLSYSDKLEAERSFTTALVSLGGHGLRGYQASRAGRLAGKAYADMPPVPFKVAYLVFVPADHELTYLLVPKQA